MTEEPKGTFAEEMSKIDENSKNVSFEAIMNAPYNKSFYKALESYGLDLEELKDLPYAEACEKASNSDAYRKYVVATFNKFSDRYLSELGITAMNKIMPNLVFADMNVRKLDYPKAEVLTYILLKMCVKYIDEHPEINEHHEFVTVFENAFSTFDHMVRDL